MQNETIETFINNPYNKCVLGYNYSNHTKRKTYFIDITNGRNHDKVFILDDEKEYFLSLIEKANKDRAIRKEQIKQDKIALREKKLSLRAEEIEKNIMNLDGEEIEDTDD